MLVLWHNIMLTMLAYCVSANHHWRLEFTANLPLFCCIVPEQDWNVTVDVFVVRMILILVLWYSILFVVAEYCGVLYGLSYPHNCLTRPNSRYRKLRQTILPHSAVPFSSPNVSTTILKFIRAAMDKKTPFPPSTQR